MSVDLERKLQNKVLHWLIDKEKDGGLGYTYLGNLEDQDNTPVKEDLLKKNLEKRGYTKDQISKAVNELVTKASNQVDSLYQTNKEVYSLLRYGKQGVKDDNKNRQTVHYIDWDNVENNDFYVAEEVSVLCFNQIERKRPDVVLYINGIALGVFELKRSCVSIGEGIRQNLTNQKKEYIQPFFSTVQLIFAGNEAEGLKYGTTETAEKYFLKWKEDIKATDDLSATIKDIQSKEKNKLRDAIVSLCQKERFLSLIYDFIIFDAGVKKVTRHNQYFANIAARKRIIEKEGGIIWNTQGSGKSLIMVWLAKWIIENLADSRVVIITDRDELDDQIESLFIDVNEKVKRAKSCSDLREILNKNDDSIICSLIHKYGHNAGKQSDVDQYRKELLKDLPADFKAKGNIIAFIDECHRTNSGKLHEAVKVLMPEAVLIGFTGTPLLKKDKKTSLETFGSYIHTYKFDEGVEDGVVLDLRYEARDVDQDLSNKEKVDLWFDNKTFGLTERAKTNLKQSWTSINKLYSSRQRLEKIAGDIIVNSHFISSLLPPIFPNSSGIVYILLWDNVLNFLHIGRGSFFMIKFHDFGIGLVEYGERGKMNEFPLFDECPSCKCPAPGNLHRNGYYWRYGITDEVTLRIPICRLRCLQCEVNISILPDFLIPYFQHTIHTVIERVNQILKRKKVNGSRQLLRFYLNRYLKCINWIHSFFISIGEICGMSGDIKKEATKYMKRILDFGESPFLRRSRGHLSKYFMAN